MIPFKLEHTIENILSTAPAKEEIVLRRLTGRSIPDGDPVAIWTYVQHHKWFMSERLGRDVGLKVATIDYFENFH